MKNLLSCLLVTLLVSGCGHNQSVNQQATIPNIHKVNIDRSLLVPCKPIPELTGDTELELISWVSEWKLVYLECKRDHSALIAAIKSVVPDSK